MYKKLIALTLVAFALAGAAFAQDSSQIAYRLLTGYITKQELQNKDMGPVYGILATSIGGLMIAGAATTWFYGDEISQSLRSTPMDPVEKLSSTIGLGVGGLISFGVAAWCFTAEATDYRAMYPEVFTETDPAIQEALAAAVLRDMSIKGQEKRMTGILVNFLAPLAVIGINIGINLTKGNAWYDKLESNLLYTAGNIAAGACAFFERTEEERLYEKYLSARQTLFGTSAP